MTTTCDIGPAKAQLRARMEAIIAANPTTVPREAQDEFNALLAAVQVLDDAGNATLSGVQRTTRVTQSQSEFEGEVGGNYTTAGSAAPGRQLARDLFGGPAPRSPFKSLGHFCWALQNGSSEIRMASGASTGNPSDGGYMIPQQYAYDMLDAGLEDEIVRPRARTEGMPYAQKIITTWDGSTHASGLISGLALEWVAEGGTIDYQIPKSRQIQLQAKKAVIMVPATNELLADAPEFGAGLGPRMREAMSFGLDRTFLATGVGAGQPISVLQSSSTVVVAKETNQSADTIVYENLTKILSRLHPGCYKNSIWLFHQTCLPQLLQLAIPVGTGGEVVPVMTGINGQYSILGRPAFFTEKLNLLGDLGDAMLVDLSQYIVGIQKDGFRLDQSSHLLFKTDETIFRLIIRIDGQPSWAKAFQPVNSAPTLSWAVTLAARA